MVGPSMRKHNMLGGLGACRPRKIFEIECSEITSQAILSKPILYNILPWEKATQTYTEESVYERIASYSVIPASHEHMSHLRGIKRTYS